ncbi:TonB-dependent receptor [Paralimibaculum aggregatum]|uniref:TonB-dependent receptor n=1 Tax=Paralimibaculum aggregatum TaxID=3036245 RepID=A0ABQ6LTV3_9RHOB|nr:TonB-dependent receptor [Limibaculum sp. NKW23]GMG85525.1 TonB-dependent receptor [Limibaculum sp. NKW23]
MPDLPVRPAFPEGARPASGALLALLLVPAAPLAEERETPAALALPELVVSAPTRTPLQAARSGASVSVLTAAELAAEPQPTLDRVLERLPGFAVASRGVPGSAGEVSVRGFGAEDILLRIDGIEFADPGELRTQPDLGQVLAGDAQRIEAVKGAQSALYGGEAVGGVIDMTTARARGSGFGATGQIETGSFGTVSALASLGMGAAGWDIAVSAQALRTDGYSAARAGSEPDGAANITLAATGSADLTESLTAGAAFRFYDRETDIDRTSRGQVIDAIGDSAASRVVAGRAFLGHRAFDERLTQELAIQQFASRREFDQAVSGFSRYDGGRTKLDYLATFAALPELDLLAGADWTREAVETSDGLDTASHITGGFVQAVWSPLAPLTLTGALRQDQHSDFGGFTTWRATAAWEALPGTVLRAAGGSGFRAPSNRELFTPEGPFGPVGNADLRPEESLTWEAGITQTALDGRLTASATYFGSRTEELIAFVFGTGYAQIPGTTRRQGVEVSLAARPLPWAEIGLDYTFLDTENPDGAPLDYAPRHDLTAALTVRPAESLRLGLRASYLAGVEDDGERLAPFLRLDLTAAWAVTDAVELFARVENALDQDYVRVTGYETPGVAAFAGIRAAF